MQFVEHFELRWKKLLLNWRSSVSLFFEIFNETEKSNVPGCILCTTLGYLDF